MSNYKQYNLNPFSFLVDRGDVRIPEDVPEVIDFSHLTVLEFENDALIESISEAYAKACRILERDDIGPRFYQLVSNLADDLFTFLNLVKMEGIPHDE
jgi:hypothetical protein